MSKIDMIAASIQEAGYSRISVQPIPEDKRLDREGYIAMLDAATNRCRHNAHMRARSYEAAMNKASR